MFMDFWCEIYESVKRKPSRTILTGIGISWGIFILIVLVGIGSGFERGVFKLFNGFSKSTTYVYASETSMGYKGAASGRKIQFQKEDLNMLKSRIPEITHLSPETGRWNAVYAGTKNGWFEVRGVYPDYFLIKLLEVEHGRMLNALDMNEARKVVLINTASKHLVVANSINDIAVVNTDDATYISDREHIDDIKVIAKEHIEEYKPYFESSKVMFRQWGMHEILSSTEHYKVKKVTIYPKMSMKLHKHEHRLESWTIVEGTATIQIGNEVKEYTKNDTVSVPIGVPHRVSNLTDSNVIIIETGIGEIMSEAEFEKKKDTDFVNIDEDSSLVSIPDIIRLEPAFKDNLWGGTKLRTVYGKKCDYDVIGESWELSAHPDGQSVIASGIFTGMYFGEFIEKYGHDVVGWKSSSLDRFPVLIKFIDAKKDLSIQIHPDDDYALEIENEFGKNEMWYVVDCEPGAFLYCGLKKDSSKEEIRERIENNTITDILNKIEVHKGDCVMVKAGTIHAIGAGILICEIQQNSNCTYRMYDYDRKDKFGNKRELHIDKAIDVVDVKKYKPFISDNKDVPEGAEVLVSCKYFECYKYVLGSDAAKADHASDIEDNCYNIETVRNTGKVNISVDAMSFRSVIVIDGSGKIAVGNNTMDYKAGDSFFVTAREKVINLEGTGTVIVTKV